MDSFRHEPTADRPWMLRLLPPRAQERMLSAEPSISWSSTEHEEDMRPNFLIESEEDRCTKSSRLMALPHLPMERIENVDPKFTKLSTLMDAVSLLCDEKQLSALPSLICERIEMLLPALMVSSTDNWPMGEPPRVTREKIDKLLPQRATFRRLMEDEKFT